MRKMSIHRILKARTMPHKPIIKEVASIAPEPIVEEPTAEENVTEHVVETTTKKQKKSQKIQTATSGSTEEDK